MEIAPGIHRIESSLGVRFMAQYVLTGDARTLLVDTGLPNTPAEALAPYMDSIGLGIEAVDDVLISHADNDHSGGKAALLELHPGARLACHELDRRWIESADAMVDENYRWHEAYGFDPHDVPALMAACGEDAAVDEGLRGGETLRLSDEWRVEVLHLPGHTFGHIGVWDPRSRAAIIIDAVLERGIYSDDGELLIPPRIYDLDGYRGTIRRLRELEPDLLLTAHYPVLDAAGGRAFLDRALAYADEVEHAIRDALAAGTSDLWQITLRLDEQFGPYPEFRTELGAIVRAVATG